MVEFKFIKREKKRPTKTKIDKLVQDAKEQLDTYQKDDLVEDYLKDGLELQKVIIVFWGWEMVYCKEYK